MAKETRHKVRATKASALALLNDIRQYLDAGAYLSWSEKDQKYVLLGSNAPRSGLVDLSLIHISEPRDRTRSRMPSSA